MLPQALRVPLRSLLVRRWTVQTSSSHLTAIHDNRSINLLSSHLLPSKQLSLNSRWLWRKRSKFWILDINYISWKPISTFKSSPYHQSRADIKCKLSSVWLHLMNITQLIVDFQSRFQTLSPGMRLSNHLTTAYDHGHLSWATVVIFIHATP